MFKISTEAKPRRCGRAAVCLLFAVALSAQTAFSQAVTASLTVGSSPAAIAVNPSTGTVYVANSAGNSVSVINGATNTVTTVSTGTNPVALAVNPLTNTIYVVNSGSNNVTVINGATNVPSTVTDPNAISPSAVALDPLTNMVYVANSGSNNLTVINGTGNTVAATVSVGNSPAAVAVNPATNRVYVSNRGGGNVSVVNGATKTVVATVTVGTTPVALTVNAATNTLYVANSGSSNLTVISGASNHVVATVGTGTTPVAVAVNPVTNTVFTANNGSGNVTVINGINNTVTATLPAGNGPIAVAADPTTNQIYVANNASNNVTVIDGANNTTITVADPNANALVALAVNPLTNTVYTANNGSSNVTVIDADSNAISATITTSTSPVAVALNTVTNMAYVVNNATHTITVINGATNQAIATVPTGTSPVAVAVNPATNMVYVANSGSNTLTVINGSNNTVVATVNTGTDPVAVAVNPVTNTVYVANNGSNNVTVIEGANHSVLTTVSVGTAPAAVAANPATGLVYVANSGSDNVTVFDSVISSNVTITDLAASHPVALAVDLLTNTIYVANSYSDNVSIINGATASVAASVNVGDTPTALALNPITDMIYVADNGNNSVSVIDGTLQTVIATVTVGTSPTSVSVNASLNRIYAANNGNNSTDFGSVTVIDGASNTSTTVTDSNANQPYVLASNPLTGEVFVVNNLSSNTSVITAEPIHSNAITVAIAPLAGNQTSSETPTFNFTASNTFSTAAVDSLLFQLDTWQGSWTMATPTVPGSFTGTTATLLPGQHTLYAYATEGEEATSTATGVQSSPLLGTISSYGFLVATPIADVAPPSLSFGNQQVGTPSSAQTVTLGNPGSATLTFSYSISAGSFSEGASDTCISAGGQLAANTSCTIFVVFTPSATGNAASTLTVTDNANNVSGSIQTVSLSGTGTTSTYTLNVAEMGSGSGTVSGTPAGINCPSTCSASFPTATQVTLTATPNAGSKFVGWSGACSGAGACTVTMNSNQAVTATFALISSTACTGTTTNWIGGASGNWSNAANWSTGIVPNGNVNVCINDGSSTPSQVTLDITASVTNLTIDSGSSLTLSSNTTFSVSGAVFNAGQIAVSAGTSNTYFTIAGAVSLSGGGTVTLSTSANGVAVIDEYGGQTLTNVNNSIQGTGYIGWNGLTVVNQAGGIINANASTGPLVLNTASMTNQGLLEATGGGSLQLSNTYYNAGGRMLASGTGSTVQFISADIQGGTLTSTGGGVLGAAANTTPTLDGSTLGTLTIAGTYTAPNNTVTYLLGTINNTGNIQINPAASNTYLTSQGNVTLTGGGTVTLSTTGAGGVAVLDQYGGSTLTNVNNLIQGTGFLGWNGLTVVNQATGVINANTTTGTLELNAPSVTNQGLIEATGGGTLLLLNTYYNGGAKITASGSGSTVQLISGTIQGGTLTTTNNGVLTLPTGDTFTLDGSTMGTLTLAGTYTTSNNTVTYLMGTINNTGTIQVNAGTSNTSLTIEGNVSLTGAGTVGMTTTGTGFAIIDQYGGSTLTNVNNLIQGAGYIGWNGLTVVNQGTVIANLPAIGPLIMNPNGLTNEGLLEATGGATLQPQGSTLNNTGGNILASGSASTVQFASGVTIQSGTLTTAGGGILGALAGNSLTLDGSTHGRLTIVGTYTAANNSITYALGTINNTGMIQLNAGANNTYLFVATPVSLVGNGVVALSTTGAGVAVIGQNGSQTLTNVDNTIQGVGYVGYNSLTLINQGTINANVAGSLIVNPNGLTNQNLLEATAGGTLVLSNTTFNNKTGTIQVNGATSTVQFANGAIIQGGTLSTLNSGVLTVPTGNNITLDGSTQGSLNISGTYVASNNTTTYLLGTINNTGIIQVNAAANNTYLTIEGTTSFTGAGVVTLTTTGAGGLAVIDQYGGQTLTNVNNTLQGTGYIGYNALSVINQAGGVINANVVGASNPLVVNPGGFTNQGLLEATGGGTLTLSNSTLNNGAGTIKVNGATSTVQFANNATIQGGTLSTANNGVLTIPTGNNITLDGSSQGTLTIAGTFTGANNTTTYAFGTINNTGIIQLNAAASNTYLTIAGTTSLTGAGAVTLTTTGAGGVAVIDEYGGQTLTNVNNTLQGTGYIGWNGLSVVNQGTINANVANSLTVNPNGFTNQGLLEATSGGTLVLSNSTINNKAGTIQVNGSTSSVQFVNGATIQGGTLATTTGGVLTIPSGNNIAFDGVTQGILTLAGTYVGSNNTTTYMVGTISNMGAIQLNAGASNTYLTADGTSSLTGTGTVTLSTTGAGFAVIDQYGGQTLTNVSNTVQGTGYIGWNGLTVINQGTINANAATSLVLNPGALTNQGTLEATGSSTLQVSTTVNNAGGSIVANGASTAVQFANGISVQGGTLKYHRRRFPRQCQRKCPYSGWHCHSGFDCSRSDLYRRQQQHDLYRGDNQQQRHTAAEFDGQHDHPERFYWQPDIDRQRLGDDDKQQQHDYRRVPAQRGQHNPGFGELQCERVYPDVRTFRRRIHR